MSDEDEWTRDALCGQADPETFFPVGAGRPARLQIRMAKALCSACPVQPDCLDWALRSGEPEGIWGGATPGERRRLRRERTVFARRRIA